MSVSPAPTDSTAAPAPAAVEPARPKMHARLPSLDQLRATANSKLGNLPSLSTSNLPPSSGPSSSGPSPSTRLNMKSLLSRKESISSISSIQEQPSTLNSPSSDGTTVPGGGTSPGGGVTVASSRALGTKAPERWKSIPTLSEIRERHMAAAASALAGKEAAVDPVADEDEKKVVAEVEGGEKKVVAEVQGLQKRKGPLADLLTRKEVVLDEMMKPPPTPVPEFKVVKDEHPLGHTWTMTYSPSIIPTSTTLSNLSLDDSASTSVATPSVSSLYTSSLLHLGDFNTIESWARLSNHLSTVPPSMLSKGGNYQLFKKGVQPIFEDPANEKGGKWVLTMRGHRASTLDDAWRETILCLVGEALESGSSEYEEDEIFGAVVSVRAKADRIQLWIKSKDPVDVVNGIGKRFVKALGLDKEGGRPAEEGSFSLEFQYNQGSAPPISKYITLSSSTSSSLARPGVKGAWRTNSSSAVPSLVAVGEKVGA